MRGCLTLAFLALAACRHEQPPSASYRPLSDVEASFGRLVTAGNHPTSDQNGTGERVGLFRDATGTVWGLPMIAARDGSLLACAPPHLHEANITGGFPAGSTIVGATNAPTGWRGGTGDLELILRDDRGELHWREVTGALMAPPGCWAAATPGPSQQLYYYRLVAGR